MSKIHQRGTGVTREAEVQHSGELETSLIITLMRGKLYKLINLSPTLARPRFATVRAEAGQRLGGRHPRHHRHRRGHPRPHRPPRHPQVGCTFINHRDKQNSSPLSRFRHSAANIERKALLYSLEKKEQEKLVNLYVSTKSRTKRSLPISFILPCYSCRT